MSGGDAAGDSAVASSLRGRAFRAVGGTPVFIDSAQGPYIFDADNKRYVDYVLSWGPMILGHAHPTIMSAITWLLVPLNSRLASI